ncbi:Nickel import ATP-binding protein NikE [Pseudodesulfovibrio hydrargyri]|uniref:Nickel import ATP-binding protein NikE n=1 Tax=Pseudodesulfovibrio hydrargyri TaxID=2125990 RepID=A0A1J5MVD7_9BACT|nr:ATP-binding cassette domain-containing protein [Pseudodesulfovibrio hydrargyri]OIQ50566.1 Nickel import ATP-binding protein NikE [Pseudodesulfovibrio hydrargyri]
MTTETATTPGSLPPKRESAFVLEAKGVTKTYTRGGFFKRTEEVPVLHGVDLAIRAGECVGLIGRSGSGKSTLGRILLGLEAPCGGDAYILGRRTTDEKGRVRPDREQRRAVQVVFQDAVGSVNPRLTAGDIIAEPLRNFERLSGDALSERVAELLVHVGLCPEDAAKHPACFSGGQLQRISIARALAPRPRCIILDEALSSLDMLVQARILDLLDRLRREDGVAYLFVTHDLRLVKLFCDRSVTMERGRLEPFAIEDLARREAIRALPGDLRELASAMLPAMPI